ncbi:hypothetical protein D3C73_1274890 [compost metagenome]
MVDPVDLFFLEYLTDLFVQLLRRFQVIAEWFLDDQTVIACTLQHAAGLEVIRYAAEQFRSQGQIENPVTRDMELLFEHFRLCIQLTEAVDIVNVQRFIFKMLYELIPFRSVSRLVAAELTNGLLHILPEFLLGTGTPSHANYRKIMCQLAFTVQTVNRREKLTPG